MIDFMQGWWSFFTRGEGGSRPDNLSLFASGYGEGRNARRTVAASQNLCLRFMIVSIIQHCLVGHTRKRFLHSSFPPKRIKIWIQHFSWCTYSTSKRRASAVPWIQYQARYNGVFRKKPVDVTDRKGRTANRDVDFRLLYLLQKMYFSLTADMT